MKKSIALFVLLLFSLSITGCSSDKYSNKLLIDSEMIDEMDIGVVSRKWEEIFGAEKREYLEVQQMEYFSDVQMANIDVQNKEQAEAVVALLKDIYLEELAPEKAEEIFFSSVNYEITLKASGETGDDLFKGLVFLLEEGKIVFADPETIATGEVLSLYISK
jgi:hypothetical protein